MRANLFFLPPKKCPIVLSITSFAFIVLVAAAPILLIEEKDPCSVKSQYEAVKKKAEETAKKFENMREPRGERPEGDRTEWDSRIKQAQDELSLKKAHLAQAQDLLKEWLEYKNMEVDNPGEYPAEFLEMLEVNSRENQKEFDSIKTEFEKKKEQIEKLGGDISRAEKAWDKIDFDKKQEYVTYRREQINPLVAEIRKTFPGASQEAVSNSRELDDWFRETERQFDRYAYDTLDKLQSELRKGNETIKVKDIEKYKILEGESSGKQKLMNKLEEAIKERNRLTLDFRNETEEKEYQECLESIEETKMSLFQAIDDYKSKINEDLRKLEQRKPVCEEKEKSLFGDNKDRQTFLNWRKNNDKKKEVEGEKRELEKNLGNKKPARDRLKAVIEVIQTKAKVKQLDAWIEWDKVKQEMEGAEQKHKEARQLYDKVVQEKDQELDKTMKQTKEVISDLEKAKKEFKDEETKRIIEACKQKKKELQSRIKALKSLKNQGRLTEEAFESEIKRLDEEYTTFRQRKIGEANNELLWKDVNASSQLETIINPLNKLECFDDVAQFIQEWRLKVADLRREQGSLVLVDADFSFDRLTEESLEEAETMTYVGPTTLAYSRKQFLTVGQKINFGDIATVLVTEAHITFSLTGSRNVTGTLRLRLKFDKTKWMCKRGGRNVTLDANNVEIEWNGVLTGIVDVVEDELGRLQTNRMNGQMVLVIEAYNAPCPMPENSRRLEWRGDIDDENTISVYGPNFIDWGIPVLLARVVRVSDS